VTREGSVSCRCALLTVRVAAYLSELLNSCRVGAAAVSGAPGGRKTAHATATQMRDLGTSAPIAPSRGRKNERTGAPPTSASHTRIVRSRPPLASHGAAGGTSTGAHASACTSSSWPLSRTSTDASSVSGSRWATRTPPRSKLVAPHARTLQIERP